MGGVQAGGDGRVPRSCQRQRVTIARFGEQGALLQQPPEAAFVKILEAGQVVKAQLVDDNQDGQPRRARGTPAGQRDGERQSAQRGQTERKRLPWFHSEPPEPLSSSSELPTACACSMI